MQNGRHTIRSGFTETHNAMAPRKYTLDNGDFEKNMKISSLDLMFAETDDAGSNQDRVAAGAIFFVIATSEAGAIPTATTSSPDEYGAQFSLRFSDNRQIAWGLLQGSGGIFQPQVIIDPDHIIPNDIYVNAWSLSTGGSLDPLANSIAFMIKMDQVTSSGNQALLYQVKESISED